MSPEPASASRHGHWRTELFAGLLGLFLGIALLKFGNPAILDRLVEAPGDVYEALFQSWPIAWGHALLALVSALGLTVLQWRWPKPWWPALLPAVWLAWQFVAATHTIDARLTNLTLLHLAATVLCYYLGLLALSRVQREAFFWGGLMAGFSLMVLMGLQQHFGGLEETRRYVHSQPGWQNLAPEYLKRLASDRIFATLLYPNALAGALLLLLPAMTVRAWQFTARLTLPSRLLVTALVFASGLGCLYWSGSKAGWLFALVQVLVCLLRLPIAKPWKHALACVCLLGGLVGFAVKFSAYFARGAPSAEARRQYWRAAVTVARLRPLAGTGPGTFAANYRLLKPPEAEMALLTHNDYLQQACDSGLPGAAIYTLFVVASLTHLWRKHRDDAPRFAVWLGLLGWSMQGLTEFGLYIPALSWTAFLWFGWLTAQTGRAGSINGHRQTPLVAYRPVPG